jgi:glutamate synthase domain-containing protein 3
MTGGRALILGKTGRNFAAGMSGGIAYVYDPEDTFVARCNTGLVDVKPLHRQSVPDIKKMLRRHVKYTGSTVAKYILDNWDGCGSQFKRVMPRDYARVLREIQQREEEKMTRVPE